MILPAGPKELNSAAALDPTNNLPGNMADRQQPSAADVDFSEFLWMEHEEEFDQEVLHELEEEDMINYYYELYEESLNNEANGITSRPSGGGSGGGGGHGNSSTIHQPNRNNVTHARPNPVNDLSLDFNRMTFSTLNPNAAEFVPRGGFGGSGSPSGANGGGSGSGGTSSNSSNSSNSSTSSTGKGNEDNSSKSSKSH